MENDVTILISSCDLYEDAWFPMISLLRKQWPEGKQYPIVLGTEEKVFESAFDNVVTVCAGKEISWTERIRRYLDKIETEYVLFMLEDFFLYDKVDEKGFQRALEIIKADKNIGMVHFVPTEINAPTPSNNLEQAFYELPVRKRTLRTRVAITLFRKVYFQRLLYGDESPWQYERESHIRSMFAGYKIIRQDYSLFPPVFPYVLDHNAGIGITNRKWLPKTKELLESNEIYCVNYENLGIMTENERQSFNKKSLDEIGFRQYFYNHVIHPIKRKIRHLWIVQDIINLKKYIKYWRYYRR